MARNSYYCQMLTALCLSLLPQSGYANEAPSGNASEFVFEKYRFQRHSSKGFERLVFEFKSNQGHGDSHPDVVLDTQKGNSVWVKQATWAGEAPEAEINEVFSKKSQTMRQITLNVDSPKPQFSVGLQLKKTGARLESFWLSNPPRLVIDAYDSADTASQSSPHSASMHSESHASNHKTIFEKKKSRLNPNDFVCYPSVSQVSLSILFQPKDENLDEARNVRVNLKEGTAEGSDEHHAPGILCFPRQSQVTASLTFEIPREVNPEIGHSSEHSENQHAEVKHSAQLAAPTLPILPLMPQGSLLPLEPSKPEATKPLASPKASEAHSSVKTPLQSAPTPAPKTVNPGPQALKLPLSELTEGDFDLEPPPKAGTDNNKPGTALGQLLPGIGPERKPTQK